MRARLRLPRGAHLPARLVAVMVVLSAVGWGLYVYDPAPSASERPSFLAAPGEPLTAPAENESYRVTVSMRSNYPQVDNRVVVRQREYFPGERPVVKDSRVVTGEGQVVQATTYRYGPRQYVRKTFNDPNAFEERVDQPGVVRADRTALTYYQVDDSEARTPAAIHPGEALEGLYMLRYERAGRTTYDGREVVRYETTPGWTTRDRLDAGPGTKSLYVRQAEGEVLVEPDSGAILKADVTGSVVVAESWADVMTGESYSISLEYGVSTDIDDPSRPPWVGSLNRTKGDLERVTGPSVR